MVDLSKEFHPLEFQPAAPQDDDYVPKDFWCVVAYMGERETESQTYDCPILKISHDAIVVQLFEELDWFDAGGDRTWCKDKKPGVYRLNLRPWSDGPDRDGEYSSGIDVYEAKLLYEFTDDDLR